ncbi:MAG: glycosyltransferase family 2 protein [Anaerolineae bacterium]
MAAIENIVTQQPLQWRGAETRVEAEAAEMVTVKPLLSIISPVHNEEAGLQQLYQRVDAVMESLGVTWELILVDDGSRDLSAVEIAGLHETDDRVRGVRLSRNFGFQIAVTAGLDVAQGEAVILMDADLQDPPEVIPQMIERWREGYDVVYGVRAERVGETWFKKASAGMFYRLMQRITSVDIPLDTGDFRLMDRRVVESIRKMSERHRFLRGLVSWVGFKQTGVTYHREARFAGEVKFTLRKNDQLRRRRSYGLPYFSLQSPTGSAS